MERDPVDLFAWSDRQMESVSYKDFLKDLLGLYVYREI